MYEIGSRVRFVNRNSQPFYGDVSWVHFDMDGEVVALGVQPDHPVRVGTDPVFRPKLVFYRRPKGHFVLEGQKDLFCNRLYPARAA